MSQAALPRIPVTRVSVGKYSLAWDSTDGFYAPSMSARPDSSVEHEFAVLIQWEAADPAERVATYELSPADAPGVDLQHTVGNTAHFIFPLDAAFFHEAGDDARYVLEGKAPFPNPRPTPMRPNIYRAVCRSDPLTLSNRLQPLNQDCLLCHADSTTADMPLQPPALVAANPQEAQWARELREQRERAVAARNPALDCRDVLFCGHSYHRKCISEYRRKQRAEGHWPKEQFDAPCPECKEVIPQVIREY